MKKESPKTICVSALTLMLLFSCGKSAPTEDILKIIETTEYNLHYTESLDKLTDMQFAMLDDITRCLDERHSGYRYVDDEEDYNRIMKRLDRYNIIYCLVFSKFNPELHPETGNQEKVVQVLALMKKMEHQALTAPRGFNPKDNKEN